MLLHLLNKRIEPAKAKRHPPPPPLPDGRDPFQSLPGELWAKIASCLPIQDAARTSVLSKQWRGKWKVATPNPHFDGAATIKFSRSGCPVSQFCCLDEFLFWIEEKVILQIEETRDEDLLIDSLGINFLHGGHDYGWIELNRDDFPGVAGYRVVSFKNPNSNCHHGPLLIGDVFSRPSWRAYLIQHLTLQHCSMETVTNHLIGDGGFNCLRGLISLALRFVVSISEESLSDLISCCPSLERLRFFRCRFVSPQGIITIRWKHLKELDLIHCSGAGDLRVFAGRRSGGTHPFEVPLEPDAIQTTFYYHAFKRRFWWRNSKDGTDFCGLDTNHWPLGFGTPRRQPMPPP